MFYANRITSLFFSLILGTLILNGCINNKNESQKTMEQKTEKTSEWLEHVNEITKSKPSGKFENKDKFGKSVILEWIKTDLICSEYFQAMQNAWDIACPTYTKVEMQFLRAHPDVVGSGDTFFKQFEPLFKNGTGNVDWQKAEAKMQEVLKSIFLSDPSTFSDEMRKTLANTAHIFVTVKDKESGKLLGFISFLVIPEFAYGDIKCIAFAVKPEEQNRGLGKLLMSSILKIIPDLKRIFLCTRITNETAQKAYFNWGFLKDKNPIIEEHNYTFNLNHWIFMEYKIDQTNVLQKAAADLK